jgi:predicted porin
MQRKHNLSLAAVAAIAATVALATPFAASAQSTVTVYGIADLYLQYGQGSTGSQLQVQTGGVSGSRLGFKGTEALGSGLSAQFQLEMGINADTGSLGQGGLAWGRQAWVGLNQDGLGSVNLGRQNIPQYVVLDTFDPYGTGAGSAASSGIVSTTSRANNSIVLKSASFGGLTVQAMTALGETGTSNTASNIYGLGAQYNAGAFAAGLALSQFKAADATKVDATYALLTGSYDFGAFKVTGGVQRVNNLGGVATVDRTEALVGVLAPVSANGTFSAGVGTGTTEDLAGSRASQYTLGYTHALSKRTKLYAIGTVIQNGAGTKYTADAASGTGPTTTNGKDVSALQVGIRHAF